MNHHRQQSLDLPAPPQPAPPPLPGGLSEDWREGFHAGRVRAHESGMVQFREGPGDRWRFYISGFEPFGDTGKCTVMRADGSYSYLPMRERGNDTQVLIAGRWYGRRSWDH